MIFISRNVSIKIIISTKVYLIGKCFELRIFYKLLKCNKKDKTAFGLFFEKLVVKLYKDVSRIATRFNKRVRSTFSEARRKR